MKEKNVLAEFWPMQSYIGSKTCEIWHVTRPDKWHNVLWGYITNLYFLITLLWIFIQKKPATTFLLDKKNLLKATYFFYYIRDKYYCNKALICTHMSENSQDIKRPFLGHKIILCNTLLWAPGPILMAPDSFYLTNISSRVTLYHIYIFSARW